MLLCLQLLLLPPLFNIAAFQPQIVSSKRAKFTYHATLQTIISANYLHNSPFSLKMWHYICL